MRNDRRYCHVCGKWVVSFVGAFPNTRSVLRPGQKHWHERGVGYLCDKHQDRATT